MNEHHGKTNLFLQFTDVGHLRQFSEFEQGLQTGKIFFPCDAVTREIDQRRPISWKHSVQPEIHIDLIIVFIAVRSPSLSTVESTDWISEGSSVPDILRGPAAAAAALLFVLFDASVTSSSSMSRRL